MHRSWFSPLARVAAPLALATMAACGSDSSTGTTTGLTASQKTALQNLLSNTNFQAAVAGGNSEAASFLGLGLAESNGLGLNSIGTINFGSGASGSRLVPTAKLTLSPSATTITGPAGTYQAFGAQLVLHYVNTLTDTTHIVWTGLIAVDNLSNPTALLTAGVIDTTYAASTSIPSTSFANTDPEAARFATASYVKINGSTYDAFYATSGNISVTSASFSGSTSCPAAQITGALKACSYASGTIQGSFNFTGTEAVTGSQTPNTVTIPAINFNVPAAQTAVTIDGPELQQ